LQTSEETLATDGKKRGGDMVAVLMAPIRLPQECLACVLFLADQNAWIIERIEGGVGGLQLLHLGHEQGSVVPCLLYLDIQDMRVAGAKLEAALKTGSNAPLLGRETLLCRPSWSSSFAPSRCFLVLLWHRTRSCFCCEMEKRIHFTTVYHRCAMWHHVLTLFAHTHGVLMLRYLIHIGREYSPPSGYDARVALGTGHMEQLAASL